jgi:hypothetical protein
MCRNDCTAIYISTCGARIDTEEAIRGAVFDAFLNGITRMVIAGAEIDFSGTVVIDECAVTGCPTGARGLEIGSLSGQAAPVLEPLTTLSAFEIESSSVTIRDITFRNASSAIWVYTSATDVRLHHLHFLNETITPGTLITVGGNQVTVEANLFDNQTSELGYAAILVEGAVDPTVIMNAVQGPFTGSIALHVPYGLSVVDHNTVWVSQKGAFTVAFSLLTVGSLCFRNNLFGTDMLAGEAHGLYADGVTLAIPTACPNGVGSASNGAEAFATFSKRCAGSSCTDVCSDSAGPLCDIPPPYGFIVQGPGLCLSADSPLVDRTGVADVGADMTEDPATLHNGTAPEVGARESGVTRTFGGLSSTCP